jgi:hypothetical protein
MKGTVPQRFNAAGDCPLCVFFVVKWVVGTVIRTC